MIRPKNETETLKVRITEHCESLKKQTHTKPEKFLEFRLTQSRETFSFKPPIWIERSWMTGLTNLEIYN